MKSPFYGDKRERQTTFPPTVSRLPRNYSYDKSDEDVWYRCADRSVLAPGGLETSLTDMISSMILSIALYTADNP